MIFMVFFQPLAHLSHWTGSRFSFYSMLGQSVVSTFQNSIGRLIGYEPEHRQCSCLLRLKRMMSEYSPDNRTL